MFQNAEQNRRPDNDLLRAVDQWDREERLEVAEGQRVDELRAFINRFLGSLVGRAAQ